MKKDVKDSIISMLLGVHIGDSLGQTLEFGPPSKKNNFHTEILGLGPFGFERGASSDDCDMTIALLKSISKNKEFNRKDVIKNFLKWQDNEPLDIGCTVSGALDNQRSTNLEFLGLTGFNRRSNGSLMRCTPMAMLNLNLDNPTDTKILEEQTTITHGEHLCKLCDKIYIKAIQGALSGKTKEEIYEQAKLDSYGEDELYQFGLVLWVWCLKVLY